MTSLPTIVLPLRPVFAYGLRMLLLGILIVEVIKAGSPTENLASTLIYLIGLGLGAGAVFAGIHYWLERGRVRVDESGLWVQWPRLRRPIPWADLGQLEASGSALTWVDADGQPGRLDWRVCAPAQRDAFLHTLRRLRQEREARQTLQLPPSDSVLETKRLRLRPWREADWPQFRYAYLTPEMRRGFGQPLRFGRITRRSFDDVRRSLEHPWAWFWAIESKSQGTVIGLVDASLEGCTPSRVRVGYGVFPPHRKQGYATEVVGALVEEFGVRREITFLTASVTPRNTASVRVLEKSGFSLGDSPDNERAEIQYYQWTRPTEGGSGE